MQGRPPHFGLWLAVVLACVTIVFSTAAGGGSSAGRSQIKPGPMKPGAYTTKTFKPALSFEVRQGWIVGAPESPTYFSLLRRDGVILAFVRVLRVIDPKASFTSDPPASALRPAPADLVAWLQHHPRLHAGKPVQVNVRGVRGVRIDTAVTAGYRNKACPRRCVFVYATPSVLAYATVGQTIRNYVFKVNGSTLTIAVLVPSGAFSRLVRQGDQVVSSVQIHL